MDNRTLTRSTAPSGDRCAPSGPDTANRRQQILSNARDVFAKRGYHAAKIDDIVAKLRGKADDVPGQTDEMLEQCSDPRGGFFLTSKRHEVLLARPKNAYDSVVPSGNSQAVRNLVRLAKVTGENRYRDAARKTLEVFAAQVNSSPAGHAYLAIGLAEYLTAFGPQEIAPETVAGTPMPPVPTPPAPIKPAQLTVFARPTAEEAKNHPLVQAEAEFVQGAFKPGAKCPIVVTLRIKDGWHINANPARPKNMKATVLKAEFTGGSALGPIEYPDGADLKFEGLDDLLSVYEGTVQLKTTIDIPEGFTSAAESVTLTIRYQPCNDHECQGPATLVLKGTISK